MTPKEIALAAVRALDEKKGKEIAAIEIADLTALADYFVIASGTSNTQINALCDAVEKALKEQGEMPLRREGYRDGTWVLLDYGCIAVHDCRSAPPARVYRSAPRDLQRNQSCLFLSET